MVIRLRWESRGHYPKSGNGNHEWHELIEENTRLVHPSDEEMNRRNAFSMRGLREIRGPSFLF